MNMIDTKLIDFSSNAFDGCEFSSTEAEAFFAQESRPLSVFVHIVRPDPKVGSARPSVHFKAAPEEIRRLGVMLIWSSLAGKSEQILWNLGDGCYLVLMHSSYHRGLTCGEFRVFSLEYKFATDREDDTPESILLDHYNPFFGYLDGAQFHGYLEGPEPKNFSSAVLISGSGHARLRLGRMLLDLTHPKSSFGGEFSLELRRFEVSAGLNSCDAYFALIPDTPTVP